MLVLTFAGVALLMLVYAGIGANPGGGSGETGDGGGDDGGDGPGPIPYTLPEFLVSARLPRHFSPLEYDIRLKPNFDDFTFDGAVAITIQVNEAPAAYPDMSHELMTLHSLGMEITDAEWAPSAGAASVPVLTPQFDEMDALERVLFELNGGFGKPGDVGVLTLGFTGELSDDLHGFYRSSYTDTDGTTKWLAVTQFEPTDARRAFPCFDEPALKAHFSVALQVPTGWTALSNMNEVNRISRSTEIDEVTFAKSPKMASYLVAFFVGEFVSTSEYRTEGSDIPVRVWARPGKEDSGEEAARVGAVILGAYEEFFDVGFPLPKQDMIAIPDFAAGAMENWGMITYRETALLADPLNASNGNKQRVAVVIAHELGHQWFGNLVTMDWWHGLWLNEGFATWMEYIGTDIAHPDWAMWEQFLISDQLRALSLDGLPSTHPIHQPVDDPAQINELFDGISYSKGGSLLHMLDAYLGRDNMRAGLANYLNDHRFANAQEEDLWLALSQASNEPALALHLEKWTLEPGYPVVTVSLDGSSGVISVSQERFWQTEPEPGQTGSSTPWWVPMWVSTQDNPTVQQQELSEAHGTLDRATTAGNWILVNTGRAGYYRTRYASDELWMAVAEGMAAQSIGPLDRIGIMEDVFAFSRSGDLNTNVLLAILGTMETERNLVVWDAALVGLADMGSLMSGSDCALRFEHWVDQLLAPVTAELGWDPAANETHVEGLMRMRIYQAGLTYDNQDIMIQAAAMVQVEMIGTADNPVPPGMRYLAYSSYIALGGEVEWEAMLEAMTRVDDASETVRLIGALAASRHHFLLHRLLNLSLDPTFVRSQEIARVVAYVARNVHGTELAWEFLRGRWDELVHYTQGFGIMNLVSGVTRQFHTDVKYAEVETFFAQVGSSGAERTVSQSLERILNNKDWIERNADDVCEWLLAEG